MRGGGDGNDTQLKDIVVYRRIWESLGMCLRCATALDVKKKKTQQPNTGFERNRVSFTISSIFFILFCFEIPPRTFLAQEIPF